MVYARRDFPFTGKQVCVLAYEMAARDNNKGFSPVKRKAGWCWLKGFYKRHPEIRKKTSINLSIGRAIATNPVQIGRFLINTPNGLKIEDLSVHLTGYGMLMNAALVMCPRQPQLWE